jgi:hypothetical protein
MSHLIPQDEWVDGAINNLFDTPRRVSLAL